MTVVVGTQVQAVAGGWNSNPTSYTYQWEISGDGATGWADISGETRSDYIVSDAYTGYYLRCCVVATNAGGSSTESCSAAVGPVALAPPTPIAVASLVLTPVVVGSLALTPATSTELVLTPIST